VLKRYPAFRPDGAGDYVLLQCADQCLSAAGYRKNHFTHYALPADGDLYYRHAVRGEDLLALGASASGVFGRAHFRCLEYPAYARATTPRPALEGVVLLSPQEHRVQPLLAALMGGAAGRQDMRAFGCEPLLDEWLRLSLVREGAPSCRCTLTAGGTWLVSSMLHELRAHAMT
jgi:coproporphyrinogen III oxidase-like Fe-S oxidoreductase